VGYALYGITAEEVAMVEGRSTNRIGEILNLDIGVQLMQQVWNEHTPMDDGT
jgi:hypothetical protein